MNTKTNLFLASTTAIALLAGVSFAAAQSQGEHPGAGAASAPKAMPSGPQHGGAGVGAQHGAPAGSMEKGAPAQRQSESRGPQSGERTGEMQHGRRSRSENTGQAEHNERSGENERMQHNGRTENSGQNEPRPGAKDQNRMEQSREKNGAKANEKSGRNEERGRTHENTGNAPARANIDTRQRTEIRSKLAEHGSVRKLSRSDIHFSLSVGARVPHNVHLFALPADIVAIVPEYRGFRYILVGDEIVIIDPVTWEIVTVIT
jgi:hypothetical protein